MPPTNGKNNNVITYKWALGVAGLIIVSMGSFIGGTVIWGGVEQNKACHEDNTRKISAVELRHSEDMTTVTANISSMRSDVVHMANTMTEIKTEQREQRRLLNEINRKLGE